ncbi:hypothetical protein, partial [Hydrogenivirga sp. 128-5-R1-1]|uniref:hypothetical protein n=1 Tax=Hydrogenivirga sp. 128-5-R1-1 TaxID=392423 RepID=UPI00015F1EED
GKISLRGVLLLILLIFIILLYFEDVFPIARFPNVLTQNIDVKKLENYKKIELIYDIKTEYNKNSLITLKDLTENIENKFIILKNNPLFFQGKYKNTYIYVIDSLPCISVFSVNELNGGFLNLLRKIKYYIVYPFNKDYAFYEKFEMLKKDTFFTEFNPVVDKCFIGSSDAHIKIKKVSDRVFNYPDLKGQVSLIKNYVYVPEDFFNGTFNQKRSSIIENLGRSYTAFYYDYDFDFYVKTKDKKTLFIGDRVYLKDNPLIYVRKPEGKFIIAVYKNGEVEKYYNSSFILKPENIGYYFFIVYKYDTKISDSIYTSVEPVIITNPIFIQ